ncbi:hypothetical protein [Butyrivibrio sp. AC2005]|uniref:hypothetical protein n=1 Tax=Butyrivibrio sp. AC2005 TaxID=1280672 RepID=UPI0004017961|nr:hypothetical protein [Butyrivibrio sp. AC2005]
MEKIKNVIVTELDIEILKCLYKMMFLTETHISVLVGENLGYVKGRLKKLCTAGLITRTTPNGIAVNCITKAGIAELGLPYRNIVKPKLGRYEHNLGEADVYVWLSMWRRFQDGTEHSWIPFGSIVTERDIAAVKGMHITGHRKDGQPIYVSDDKDIHIPDGYIIRKDSFAAIEYERTAKSSNAILKSNIRENMRRFHFQYWIYDDPYVGKILYDQQKELGKNLMAVYDIRQIRKDIDAYKDRIPSIISQKTGIPRKSCLGTLLDPIPLNKLPLRPTFQNQVTFESRDNSVEMASKNQIIKSAPDNITPNVATQRNPSEPVQNRPFNVKSFFERR